MIDVMLTVVCEPGDLAGVTDRLSCLAASLTLDGLAASLTLVPEAVAENAGEGDDVDLQAE